MVPWFTLCMPVVTPIAIPGLGDKPRPMWSRGTEMHGMPGVKCRRRGMCRSSPVGRILP